MRQFGQVDIPQSAFIAALRMGDSGRPTCVSRLLFDVCPKASRFYYGRGGKFARAKAATASTLSFKVVASHGRLPAVV